MRPIVRSVVAMTAHFKLQAYGFFVGRDVLMTVPDELLLTLDEAYRATFSFHNQYYHREAIVPFMLMLNSMAPLRAARASERLPEIAPPRET